MAYKALLIGNGQFGEDSGLRCLKGPRNDLTAMKKALTDSRYGLFKGEDIVVCPDLERAPLITEFKKFVSSTSREDYLLIYYTGHGIKPHEKLYLAARDSTREEAWSDAVPADVIQDVLESNARAERVTLILDCCFAGAYVTKGDDGLAVLERVLPGKWYLASSSETETSKDAPDEGSPSPFTAALADALTNPSLAADSTGMLTLDVVYRFIQGLVPPPKLSQHAQGLAPIARREPQGDGGSIRAVDDLAEWSDEDVEIDHRLELSSEQATTLRHLTALLGLARQIRPGPDAPPSGDAVTEAAAQYVSKLLRTHALDDSVLEEVRSRSSPHRLTRLRLKAADVGTACLPWEYLEIDSGTTGFSRGPLAFRRNLIVERRIAASDRHAPPDEPVKQVALIGIHPGEAATEIEQAIREDLKRLNVEVNPSEMGRRLTYDSISRRPELPPVLVILAALRMITDPQAGDRVELQLATGTHGNEWVDAERFLEILGLTVPADVAPYRAIIIEALSADPAQHASLATAQLALSLAELGLGDVVFVCHPAKFAGYPAVQASGSSPLRSYVGNLVNALNRPLQLHRAAYVARLRMEEASPSSCQREFGIPGVYALTYAKPEGDRAAPEEAPSTGRAPRAKARPPITTHRGETSSDKPSGRWREKNEFEDA